MTHITRRQPTSVHRRGVTAITEQHQKNLQERCQRTGTCVTISPGYTPNFGITAPPWSSCSTAIHLSLLGAEKSVYNQEFKMLTLHVVSLSRIVSGLISMILAHCANDMEVINSIKNK